MKKILALLLALMMLASLVACSTKQGTPAPTDTQEPAQSENAGTETPEQPAQPETPAEIPTVTMLTFTDWYKSGWEALTAYIDEHAEELGFRLKIDIIAGGGEGEELVRAKFATGDLPDLLQTYGPKWLDHNAGVLDQIVPLQNVDMSEYSQDQLEEGHYIYDGQLYAVPMDSTSLVGIFYNKDVFAAAGIEAAPMTWDEFLDCCEKLKAIGVTPLYYSGADTWTLQCITHFGFNEDVVESGLSYTEFWNEMNTNKRHYSDAINFKNAIIMSKDMVEKGYVNSSFLSDTYDMAQTALAEGTAGMYCNGTWVYDEIAGKYPESADKIGSFILPLYEKNYTCSSMPGSVVMTAACKDQALGEKVLNFLASSEAQQIYATAQPGIYLNQKVTCELPEAYQTLYDEMLKGNSMEVWQNGNVYHYGDYHIHVQDYLAGGMDIDQVISLLDSDTADNAKAANDPNWN